MLLGDGDNKACTPVSIVFVDDEALIRALVSRLFDRLPVLLRCAGCVDEALLLLEEEHVDLLITDYQMPGRTGLDLIEHVRARWPQIRSLLVSGDAAAIEATQARGIPAMLKTDMHKPLLALVAEMLEHRRSSSSPKVENPVD